METIGHTGDEFFRAPLETDELLELDHDSFVAEEELPETQYARKLSKAFEKTMPAWYKTIPWHRMPEYELEDEDLHCLDYMSTVEGHVCSGYLVTALSSPIIRVRTLNTDQAVTWGINENWHATAETEALDRYYGRTESTRASRQDAMRSKMSVMQLHGWLVGAGVAAITPKVFTAVYASMGYRNELMTMRGYGSLLTNINQRLPEPHPVIDPMLRNIMREESEHAAYYEILATELLEDSAAARKATRFAMNHWWGTVGENIGGSDNADRVIRHLFEDGNGRRPAEYIDSQVASLPGLEGVTPMQARIDKAFGRG